MDNQGGAKQDIVMRNQIASALRGIFVALIHAWTVGLSNAVTQAMHSLTRSDIVAPLAKVIF